MLTRVAIVLHATLLLVVRADVYLHNPRGSNNRLNEASATRRNAARLFDTQNNERGGYNVGDSSAQPFTSEAEQYNMQFFQSGAATSEGSYLDVEWTSQHGCGGNDHSDPHKLNCNLVLQYSCSAALRNGVTTATGPLPPLTATTLHTEVMAAAKSPETIKSGMHEHLSHYARCSRRQRNARLFTADQVLKRNDARATRQNPNGNRNGYECPEERDYYPYWHPTPWVDVAVLTDNVTMCPFFKKESLNVKPRGECLEYVPNNGGRLAISRANTAELCARAKGTWVMAQAALELEPSYSNAETCLAAGFQWAVPAAALSSDEQRPAKRCLRPAAPPDCRQAAWTRSNHLGDGRSAGMPSYRWRLPHFTDGLARRCVLRLRYNISTDDYQPWATDATVNGAQSPVQQNPYVQTGLPSVSPLRLALNTAQTGRTFQDRSHVFVLAPRAAGSAPTGAQIFNLNVRGKRGNIVQTYPAVEYDFAPSQLRLGTTDLVHLQWTGSNSHLNGAPAGDGAAGAEGQGKAGTDRHNVLALAASGDNFPATWEAVSGPAGLWAASSSVLWPADMRWAAGARPLDWAVAAASAGFCRRAAGCVGLDSLLDNANASFAGLLLQVGRAGEYRVMCTRNNAFSNRSQKGLLHVLARSRVDATG